MRLKCFVADAIEQTLRARCGLDVYDIASTTAGTSVRSGLEYPDSRAALPDCDLAVVSDVSCSDADFFLAKHLRSLCRIDCLCHSRNVPLRHYFS